MSNMYQIFLFFVYEMVDSHKQTLRCYCQDTLLILHSWEAIDTLNVWSKFEVNKIHGTLGMLICFISEY